MTFPLLVDAVNHVLKMKAKNGRTTKHDATLLVLHRIEKTGGPTKYGIGAAALRIALKHITEMEVGKQLKQPLTEHEYKHMLPAHTPMEVIAALGKTPRWIAINEGVNAQWIFSLQATPDEWRQNAALKQRKAEQTWNKALVSTEIADFLTLHKFTNLAEAISKGT